MNDKKFYLLDYSHEEIEILLDKIATGNVLSNEDYIMLTEVIGISNISTFNGDYDNLINKPTIPGYMSDLINDLDFDTVVNVNNKIQAVRETLIALINSGENQNALLFSTKTESENMATSLKIYTDEEIVKAIKNLNLTGFAAKSEVALKADKIHLHSISDINGLIYELESRSKIDHNHDNLYALKQTEHYHPDVDAINTITQEKLDDLDNFIYETKEMLMLKSDIDHNHDTEYADKRVERLDDAISNENLAAITRLFPEDIERWDNMIEFNTNGKLTTANVGGVSEGADLSGLNIHDILRRVLYPDKKYEISAKITVTPSGSVFERGTSVTVNKIILTIVEKGSNPIKEILFYENGAVIGTLTPSDNTASSYELELNKALNTSIASDYYRVQLKDSTEVIVKANTSAINFYPPYYYGVVDAGVTPNADMVSGMTKLVAAKGQQSCVFNMNNQCAVFAYPASFGNLSSILDPNSFEQIRGFRQTTVSIIGKDNVAQNYNVYIGEANTNTNFKMTFKF